MVFDFVVVGAGSAGCAIADQLSADGRFNVAVVEAGGSDRRLAVKVPIGYAFTFNNPAVNWKYWTEPDPGLGNRRSYWPRGKVVGGSSSINAMLYCRGLSQDFDDWATAGATGWDWESVRPVFEAMESKCRRGTVTEPSGPLVITDPRASCHPINAAFLRAATEARWPVTDDYNHEGQEEGLCYFHSTTRNGWRWSSADAFLRPALGRGNVTLMRDRLVSHLCLDGREVTGVVFADGSVLRARRETILCAGAVGSPVLLQRSGIGPGEVLQQRGVETKVALPAVGRHMQDHLGITYFYGATVPTLNSDLYPFCGRVKAGLQYLLKRDGPLSLPVNQCGGFMRSSAQREIPDMQLYCNPVSYSSGGGGEFRASIDREPGFILGFCPCRPTSRGTVELASPDADAAPLIQPNSLSTDKDLEDVRRGGALLRQLTATPTMREITKGAKSVCPDTLDDEGLVADFRARAGTNFHPSCTCRMGRDESDSVLDARLRVHGVSGLRVADASSFPSITSANTNAPAMMLGRRAGSLVCEDHA